MEAPYSRRSRGLRPLSGRRPRFALQRTLPHMPRSRIMRIALGFLAALCMLVGVLWWLTWTPPRWYQPPESHDTSANELGALVERRLAEEIHAIRETDTRWQLRIRDEQINAWLATRMPQWLEHERGMAWPSELGTPQVRFDQDRISMTVPVRLNQPSETNRRRRPITLTVRPHLRGDALHVTLTDIRIGRLPLPGDPMNHVAKQAGDRLRDAETDGEELMKWIMRLMTGKDRLTPTVELIDSRRVTVESIRIRRGTLDVTAVTADPAGANRK